MEDLKYLACQFDVQLKPTITPDEFMLYVKMHKNEMKPFINEAIWVDLNGLWTCFLSLLCLVGFHHRAELVYFVLEEFDDVVNVNVNHRHHALQMNKDKSTIKELSHHTLELLLADHPKFDVNKVVHHSHLFDIPMLEKIFAKADPYKVKPVFCVNYGRRVVDEYIRYPVKTHKRLKLKHYGKRDACRVFIFALLIENKFFL